jgi:hypothetical protein
MSKNVIEVKVNDKNIKLKVLKITPEILLESSEFYAKAFSSALAKGMPLHEELRKIYEDRGLLDTTADDKKMREARKELKDLEIKLRKGTVDNRRMTPEEGKALALSIRKKRVEALQSGSRNSDLFSNSAENYADNERSKHLISVCTVYADTGEKYWKHLDEFVNEKNEELVTQVVRAFATANYGSGDVSDYEKNLYENQWLRKMNFMNDKLQLIRGDGKSVDEEGRLIDTEGRFINDSGDYVDIYGNRIDKDGNLLVEDTWGVNANSEIASEPKSLI